jgi:hypothetical protein
MWCGFCAARCLQMSRLVVVLDVLPGDSTVQQHHEHPTGFVHSRDVAVLKIGFSSFSRRERLELSRGCSIEPTMCVTENVIDAPPALCASLWPP